MSSTSTQSDAIVVDDLLTGKDTLTPDHGPVESDPAKTSLRQFSLGTLQPTSQPDSGSRTKLFIGVLAGTAVALGSLAYSLLPDTTEKATVSVKPPEQVSAPARPPTASPTIQTGASLPTSTEDHNLSSPSATPESRPMALPAQRPAGSSAAEAEPPENLDAGASNVAVAPSSSTGGQTSDFVFLQRPGVNMRAEPNTKGRVLGTAPKGTRFSVMNRNGKWVYVDSGRLKGWVSARFLGPNPP
jgi:hypothetical protein